ncbi:hypothetical protein AWJ20_130 [Sugiyamaella lignohabitans]|uniref:Glycosyltransferase family 69 protein n=1 Tax=Sugiyamaella lignohabitans TaxID=796027 RepID=A0A167CMY7_9ASCO|nr:uncharacterized protein AWJ20_130 [Sugiyamaella lignohabitans]ANB11903.1 hypothetical protein AWJ20_130 [Sugiyamaella lignohabitans]
MSFPNFKYTPLAKEQTQLPSPTPHSPYISEAKVSFDNDLECPLQPGIQPVSRTPLWVSVKRFIKRFILFSLLSLLSLLTLTAVFNPSYTNPPDFKMLDEKVFITANIINGDLIRGRWGDSVVELIDLLGPQNVFLSIYGGPTDALKELEPRIKCDHSLVSEQDSPIHLESLPHIIVPGTNDTRVKRTEYLANVRNKALEPLNTLATKFDKILFMNDIIFNPHDAARLLFSTNVVDGKTDYRAACSVDFVNAFKFYDTFATRDFEGNSMGLPFFPWFANIGSAQSRRDVLNSKEAVRVRSCWGGMIAFEAKWFQSSNNNDNNDTSASDKVTTGTNRQLVRFRAEHEATWDASECCLINADLEAAAGANNGGIYMNPYVRVAYDEKNFKWLAFTRRFERLYSLIHDILNRMVSLPHKNPRYQEEPGQVIIESEYNFTQHQYQPRARVAGIGGYCGSRMLQVMKTHPKQGERMWESVKL